MRPHRYLRGRTNWAAVALQIGMHVMAGMALAHPHPSAALGLIPTYFATCLGISLGYHRLISHQSFRGHPLLEGALVLLGVFAVQGGPIRWACLHRSHHAYADGEGDPYAASLGFLWSHQLWALFQSPNGFMLRRDLRSVRALYASRWLRFLEDHGLKLNVAAAALSTMAFGVLATLWLFPLRVVLVWHASGLINSLTHNAHLRPRERGEEVRNIYWLAWLTCGEGLHRNHHDRPSRAYFDERIVDGDIGGWCLRWLNRMDWIQFRGSHEIHRVH